MPVTVDEFQVADPADAWTRAGFSIEPGAVCHIGSVDIRLIGREHGTGIVGWSLSGLPSNAAIGDLDGIPTTTSSARTASPATHPNGVIAIDEVVGSPETASESPSTGWGLTYVVADIDATAAFFGDRTAPVKAAVQPGRRITTLRHHELGMSVRTAFISAPIVGA